MKEIVIGWLGAELNINLTAQRQQSSGNVHEKTLSVSLSRLHRPRRPIPAIFPLSRNRGIKSVLLARLAPAGIGLREGSRQGCMPASGRYSSGNHLEVSHPLCLCTAFFLRRHPSRSRKAEVTETESDWVYLGGGSEAHYFTFERWRGERDRWSIHQSTSSNTRRTSWKRKARPTMARSKKIK